MLWRIVRLVVGLVAGIALWWTCGDAWNRALAVMTQPLMKIDVATNELIDGVYLPILGETGTIAGAQIWQEKRADGKWWAVEIRLGKTVPAPGAVPSTTSTHS